MHDIEKYLIAPDDTLSSAFATLERLSAKIVIIVTEDRRLLGTITDGDCRRGLLRGVGLNAPVSAVMNPAPVSAFDTEPRTAVLARMRRGGFRQMPILDSSGRVVDLIQERDFVVSQERGETVVLMAGGLGQRLRPLTDDVPKPMLAVGGKPILETIVERFAAQGFRDFFISVNYRRHDIVNHFGDGRQFGVDIRYIEEATPTGTAGALALLPEGLGSDLIVMNGDILTRVDLAHLIDYHRDHGAGATVCAREYDFRIPYGVIEVEDHRMVSIVEKPLKRVLVNAGIYAISEDVLGLVPTGMPFDMPELLSKMGAVGRDVAVFPIREYWIDIGRLDDLERARDEFADVFGMIGEP